jgi:hypothetical protein
LSWPLATNFKYNSLPFYGGVYGVNLCNNTYVSSLFNVQTISNSSGLQVNQYDNSEPSFKKPISRVFYRLDGHSELSSLYKKDVGFLKKN